MAKTGFRFSLVLSCVYLTLPVTLFSQAKPFEPDLANVATAKDVKIVNRAVSASDMNGKAALRFDERPGDGLALWPDVAFADGTIEFDVRGKDVVQQSFVGVAFHGVGETYEAVYFRPFNFRAGDSERQSHSLQYVSQPTYTWDRLRSEHPGQYEKAIAPAPDPGSWVHARIVVAYPKVSVYVNNAAEPSLVVDELSDHKSGWVGLWVGNGSGGEFANFKVSLTEFRQQRPQISKRFGNYQSDLAAQSPAALCLVKLQDVFAPAILDC